MPKQFTQEEKDFIRANYKTLTAKVIADKFGRTKSSIQHAAQRLDVPPKHRADAWTKDELSILRIEYPKIGSRGVSALLGRSVVGVRHRASREGISTGPEARDATNKYVQSLHDKKKVITAACTWKSRVKRRDDYTCQLCRLREPLIVTAHHIEPVGEGGAKFDVKNGMTVCPNCHALIHALKGRGTSGKRLPPETYKAIRDLLFSGHTRDYISSRIKVNHKTIHEIRKKSLLFAI